MRISVLSLLLCLAPMLPAGAAAEALELEPIRALLRDRATRPQAQAAIERLLADHPRSAAAHALLGAAKLQQDDVTGAVQAYEQAASLAPADSEIQRQLGDAYGRSAQKAGALSKLGWARKCKAAYEKAVSLDPRNLAARQSLLTFYQAAPGIVGGGMDKAYAQAAAIKELDPTRGRLAFANLYVAEKKFAAAFAEHEAVLRDEPDNYAALYQIGRLAALSGERLDAGLAALGRCLELDPPAGQPGRAPTQWRIGNLHEKRGDLAAARAAYEEALRTQPDFAEARASLQKLD